MTGRWTLNVMFASSLHIESDLTELLENHGYQDTDPQADNYIDGGVNWGYTAAQMGAQADPLTVVAIAALLLLIISRNEQLCQEPIAVVKHHFRLFDNHLPELP